MKTHWKTLSIVTLLLALPVSASFATQTGQTQAGASTDARPVAEKSIKPGDDCHTNGDGVKVCNTGSTGDGKFTINPQTGSADSATTVKARNNAKGDVTGIDGNDTVKVSNGADITVSGSGGTVNVGSGGAAKVTNTNAPGTNPPGANITVTVGSGTVTVLPGMTVPVAG